MQKNSVLRERCCSRFLENVAPLLSLQQRDIKAYLLLCREIILHLLIWAPLCPLSNPPHPLEVKPAHEITPSHTRSPAVHSCHVHFVLLHLTYLSPTKLHRLTTRSEFFRFYHPPSSNSPHPSYFTLRFFSLSPGSFPLSFP